MVTLYVYLALPKLFLVQAYLGGLGNTFKEFITAFNLQYSLVPTAINGIPQTAISIAVVRRKVKEHTSRIQIDSNIALFNKQQRRGPLLDYPVYKYCNKRHKGTYQIVDLTKALQLQIDRNAEALKKRKTTDDVVFGDKADVKSEH